MKKKGREINKDRKKDIQVERNIEVNKERQK